MKKTCFYAALFLSFFAWPLHASPPGIPEAEKLFDEGRFAESKAILLSAEKEDPENPRVLFNLGRISLVEGEYDASIDRLEDAVYADSACSRYHQWLGMAYGLKAQRTGGFDQILKAKLTGKEFTKAVETGPGNAEARYNLMTFCLQAPSFLGGGMEKAKEHAKVLEETGGAHSYMAKASILRAEGDVVSAGKALEEGAAKCPDSGDLRQVLGEYYIETKQHEKALLAFEKTLKANPEDKGTLLLAGRAGAVAGKKAAFAEECLKKYLRLQCPLAKPQLAEAHYWLSVVYSKQGKAQAAKQEEKLARETDPGFKKP